MNALLNWLFPIRLDRLTVPSPAGTWRYTVTYMYGPVPELAVTKVQPYIAKDGETIAAYSEAWIA